MSLYPIHAESGRRAATSTAVMTTLASPTQGHARALSMWRVEMPERSHEPCHVVDSEQIWHVTRGRLAIRTEEASVELAAGDTVVLPESVARELEAITDTTAIVCGFGDAEVSVPGRSARGTTPPWIE